MKRLTLWLVVSGCATAVSGSPRLAEFRAVEHLGIDWPRTMVTYRVKFPPGRVRPGRVRLVGPDAAERRFQLWRVKKHADGSIASARISFLAALAKDGEYCYRLLAGRPAKFKAHVAVHRNKDAVVLDNGIAACRLPGEGAGPDGSVFGGVRLVDGRWVGGSHWIRGPGAPRITARKCRVTASGPLFAEAVVNLTFRNGGWYRFTAQLRSGEDFIRIDEQCDLKTIRRSRDWWVAFSLSDGKPDGFRPDVAYWVTQEGRLKGKDEAFEAAAEAAGFAPLGARRRIIGSRAIARDKTPRKLMELACWYPYWPTAYYVGLAERSAVRKGAERAKIPFVGIVPLHAGNWRGMADNYNGELWTEGDGRVSVRWPLTVTPHPNSLLHTGEYDPALPYTFIRRQWALVAGPMKYFRGLYDLRMNEGFISLDDYKDWVLEWPRDPKVTYPRLVFSKADVERLKPTLKDHPAAETLGRYLYFNDDQDRCDELFKKMGRGAEWYDPRGLVIKVLARTNRYQGCDWVAGFRHSQRAHWAAEADELLASRRLSPPRRKKLRAWLAACCHALAEPDFNPRGMMAHLGNPNMPINRFFGLAFIAALIPDHPHARQWLDASAEYLRYKLAMNVAPPSAWSELITYFPAAASHVMQAAAVLEQAGRLDDRTARLAVEPARFTLHLLAPPDARFGARSLPNWGHEGADIGTHWLVAAALMRRRDPALARELVWAWDQLGRPMTQHHDAGFSPRAILHSDLLAGAAKPYAPPDLRSVWLPGFGGVLRSHANTPGEVFLACRQGYLVSHCDANQGDFILHARGVPLTTMSIHGYAIHDNRPFAKLNEQFGWHNRVRFGERAGTGGWPGGGPASQVHAYTFSPTTDYLRGHGDYRPQRWTRQIVFCKARKAGGDGYFIVRDSFRPVPPRPGTGKRAPAKKLQKTFWYLRTPEGPERNKITPTGLTHQSPFGDAALDCRFLQPAKVAAESRTAVQEGPLYNQASINWRRGHGMELGRGGGRNTKAADKITVNCFGPIQAGQDILVLLQPRGKKEQPVRWERLGDGIVRVRTRESTDYVFVRPEPFRFRGPDVSFAGRAGAVRIFDDEVHLAVLEGPGQTAYKGLTLRSHADAHHVARLAGLTGGLVVAPAVKHSISFSLGRKAAKTSRPAQGVTRHDLPDGFALAFDAAQPVRRAGEATFHGRKGGLVLDRKAGTLRVVVEDGWAGGVGKRQAWGCEGPYEVTFGKGRVTGRSAGRGRILYLRGADIDRLPMLVIDGQTYAPGTSGNTLIVPLLPGEHTFEIRPLPQPRIWRNWQHWD